MNTLFTKLKNQIEGEVRCDALTRRIYSVDASIYEVEPLGIVTPKSTQDILTTLQLAKEYGVSVTPRGAATGITGSCLGKGIIIDTSKYLNRILEINIDQEYAICEPGVIQDRLNEALSSFDYRLGPDTSTGNRATIGGMLANNSAGARSLYYGRMVDHVEEVELALADGSLITFSPLDAKGWKNKCEKTGFESHIYREIERILKTYSPAIIEHFPKIPRHVSGYNLDILVKMFPNINLSKLIVGSEGTLGIATKIKVKIAKKHHQTGLAIIHLNDFIPAMKSIPIMLKHRPIALEMIDERILASAKLSPNVRNKLNWLVGNPQAIFVAEFAGENAQEVHSKLENFSKEINSLNIAYAIATLEDPQQIAHVWEVRKAGLGLLLSKRSYSRAIAFIEDLSISPTNLAAFMSEFCAYLKSLGKEAGIYGHIGSGCMHIRPYMDLRQTDELHLLKKIMDDVSTMVLKHGGALSGEHGDGLIRSWLNEKMFGPEVYSALVEVKEAFDPQYLINPGKIVKGPSVTQDLRISPQTPNISIPTFLDFHDEGGIELAADLCNGNGQCRKSELVMCPSFQATGDEYHTTRARAQSLRAIIHGKLPIEEFTGKALHDVLDLCIECKGCKRECPSQVDMAKMKAEFLYQYQQKHGYPLRNKIFGHIHTLNSFISPLSSIINPLAKTRLSKGMLSLLGITPERDLPHLAQEKFSTWFHKQPRISSSKQVILFNDTYTEFHQPEIGKAAYKLLTTLGYEVLLVSNFCCGRPLISKGLLKEARIRAKKLIEHLFPYAERGLNIVGLEPSCVSALIDDYRGLIGTADKPLYHKLETVMAAVKPLDEFLKLQITNGKLNVPVNGVGKNVHFHGHCHQKALHTTQAMKEVLQAAGYNVTEIPSGCCGMAGSFGYEKEHYDISMKIGELKLLPAVREAPRDTLIIANGFSCRSQIVHGTNRPALHLAEALVNIDSFV